MWTATPPRLCQANSLGDSSGGFLMPTSRSELLRARRIAQSFRVLPLAHPRLMARNGHRRQNNVHRPPRRCGLGWGTKKELTILSYLFGRIQNNAAHLIV